MKILSIFAVCGLLLLGEAQAAEESRAFDIRAQGLSAALSEFAKQSQREIVFTPKVVKNKKTAGVKGTLEPLVALEALLKDTGLKFSTTPAGAILVGDPRAVEQTGAGGLQEEKMRVAQTEGPGAMQKVDASSSSAPWPQTSATEPRSSGYGNAENAPEILVQGKKSLNTDIQRTEDDPQPYVVFNRQEIERSQAINVEDFLRSRLPMNAAQASNSQVPGSAQTNSVFNLRGLGQNQTLILVDGRRIAGVSGVGQLVQADTNGIPLAAIERIEVLPTTAGGIYGGSATGGVINIVLRRDFRGLDAKASYANTFDTDASSIRLEANAGFSLENGRTQVMLAVAHSDANTLVFGDRDFSRRAIALQLRNNPNVAAFTTSASPPLGATVNIRSVSGNLVLDPAYGGSALGSNITHIPLGYAGPASDSGAALVANAGTYNLAMPAGMSGEQLGLIAAPAISSATASVRREFGRRLEAFVDLSIFGNKGNSFRANIPTAVSNLPASAPNNPFQQAINIRFPTPGLSFENRTESTTARAAGGLIARLAGGWTGEVDYNWGRSRLDRVSTDTVLDTGATAAGTGALATGLPAPDGRPALNALQEANTFPLDFGPYLLPSPNNFDGPSVTILKDIILRLAGPALQMPAGPLTLSALVERREEEIQDTIAETFRPSTRTWSYALYPRRSQDADSYYVEARVPLISSRNASPGVRELEAQLSWRRDEYETRTVPSSSVSVPGRDGPFPVSTYTVGRVASTDYTLGLRYMPIQDVALRASFGTGFLPPSVVQIVPRSMLLPASLGNDPKRGNTPMYVGVAYTSISDGNPDLQPERSESWSAGLVLTPAFLPSFRLSIDYTNIEKEDEIQTPPFQFLLDNEDSFPGRIIRGAKLTGDPASWAGPIASFDWTLINIARTQVSAYDIQADYRLQTEKFGEFQWYALVTRQTHYKNQTLPGQPIIEYAGFDGRPLKWRGNAGFNWEQGVLTLSWNAQYYDSYMAYAAGSGSTAAAVQASTAANRAAAVLNQGSATIPRQIYHDLVATFSLGRGTGSVGALLANSQISLGIQNLFDTSPPILASTSPAAAGYSAYGDPRLRRYTLSIRKSFGGE